MADTGSGDWPGGAPDQPDFGPPGPADSGGFRAHVPPPPPPPAGTPMPDRASAPDWDTGFAAARTQKDTKSTAALVTGLLGLILTFLCAALGVPLAIAAIVLGIQGRKQARYTGSPSGAATAGLVLGVISLTLLAVFMVAILVFSAGAPSGD